VVRGRQPSPSRCPVVWIITMRRGSRASGEQARLVKTVNVQDGVTQEGGSSTWTRPSVPGHREVSKAAAGGSDAGSLIRGGSGLVGTLAPP
jgi:hypothetical protein